MSRPVLAVSIFTGLLLINAVALPHITGTHHHTTTEPDPYCGLNTGSCPMPPAPGNFSCPAHAPITTPECAANYTLEDPPNIPAGAPVYNIPIVWTKYRQGAAGNLSSGTIAAQIATLNDDFAGLSQANGVDTRIRFYLADGPFSPNDPDDWFHDLGCPDIMDQVIMAASAGFPATDYLNIVSGDMITNAGNFGETHAPWDYYGEDCDGIVIDYRTVDGTHCIYDNGHALSHEVGHWFGLYHTHRSVGSCPTETNCNTEGDMLCDTPVEQSSPHTECGQMDCDNVHLIDNFMSYMSDACKGTFTQDQAFRMRCFIENIRSDFVSGRIQGTVRTGAGNVFPGPITVKVSGLIDQDFPNGNFDLHMPDHFGPGTVSIEIADWDVVPGGIGVDPPTSGTGLQFIATPEGSGGGCPKCDPPAEPTAPSRLVISGANPNPFNPSTNVNYTLPVEGDVVVEVHDVNGRRLHRESLGHRAAGDHVWTWNAKQATGLDVASGVYYVRLASGGQMATMSVVLLK
jgi:hypothetical protein